MLNWFNSLTFIEFFIVLSAANVAMYVGSWVIVKLTQRLFAARMMNVQPAVVTKRDLLLSLFIVAINIAVGIPGWMLWKAGYIELREPSILATVIDTLIIFFFFDLMMYLLHRMMHFGPFYRMIHGRHHDHIDVNGISFYVMNPAEA